MVSADMAQDTDSLWTRIRSWWHGETIEPVSLEDDGERQDASEEATADRRQEEPGSSSGNKAISSLHGVTISERLWGAGYTSTYRR